MATPRLGLVVEDKPTELSCTCTLTGPLSAVTGFRRLPSNQVLFSWTPPPTLDLTDVDPDIIYGIEVYNITCGSHDLLSHNYNLATSFYGDALLDPDYVYKVVIIPRSNVHGAKNGTRLVEYGKYYYYLYTVILHEWCTFFSQRGL